MTIGKPRPNGQRQVFVYDSSVGRKVYVGSRQKLRGPGGAQELEREKTAEFAARTGQHHGQITIAAYAQSWLELHHGPNTRRPAPTTRAANMGMLGPFLAQFGHRPLDGGITRREALAWGKKHPHAAKVVSAMWNDAIDEEACAANPFANRRQEQPRGRRDITPVTEGEVTELARIAREMWGADGYGLVAAGMILFAAWVGCRPGETFGVTLADMDFRSGLVTIRRVKKRGQDHHPVDVVVFPRAAQDAVRAIPNVPVSGPVFRTITGRPVSKGSHRYVWDPVRKAFEAGLSDARRAELLGGRADLDFYELRHFCASLLVERGCTEFEVAAQLGNSPEVARETYVHAYEDRVRDRVRLALDSPAVVDLDDIRTRKRGGSAI